MGIANYRRKINKLIFLPKSKSKDEKAITVLARCYAKPETSYAREGEGRDYMPCVFNIW